MCASLVLADLTVGGMVLLAVVVSAAAVLLAFTLTAVIRRFRSRR